MPQRWTDEFQDRMHRFERRRPGQGRALSVNIRVSSRLLPSRALAKRI